jgi:hypothetical protein
MYLQFKMQTFRPFEDMFIFSNSGHLRWMESHTASGFYIVPGICDLFVRKFGKAFNVI